MVLFSGILVIAFGLFLFGLAILIFVYPQRAERFLNLFASSARAHYTEQLLRLLIGASLVIFSPSMWFSPIFQVFGWIIVLTSVGLLLVPWHWHQWFGKWAIPMVIRHMRLYAIGALALGTFVFYGTTRCAFT